MRLNKIRRPPRPNIFQVIDLLSEHRSLTRRELQLLGRIRSRRTVDAVVRDLSARDIVTINEHRQGEKAGLVTLHPSLGATAGIAFGRGRIRVAVSDLSLRILSADEAKVPVANNPMLAFDSAVDMMNDLMTRTGLKAPQVIGVGVGLPGPMNQHDPVASESILPGWTNIRPREVMQARLDLPIVVDNDANLAALGELTVGSARGSDHVVYVLATAGIGCGLIINGDIYRGAVGIAGEFGHMVLDPKAEIECPTCHNKGCVDSMLGGQAIAERMQAHLGEIITPDEALSRVIERSDQNDDTCKRLVEEIGQQLGPAVANLCTLINPQRVVIGGRLSDAGELICEPIRRAVNDSTLRVGGAPVSVDRGQLGDRAVVHGALAFVMRSGDPRILKRLHSLVEGQLS